MWTGFGLHTRRRWRPTGGLSGRSTLRALRRLWTLATLCLLLPGTVPQAAARDDAAAPAAAALRQLRAEEIAQCWPGEWQTWGDGQDRPAIARPLRLVYRHDGAPPWFSPTQLMQSLLRAADAWSACGVPAYVLAAQAGQPIAPGAVSVVWDDVASAGHFGLAHLAERRLALGASAFARLRERNPRHPAEEVLQMVVAHEMGHFYGLMAHSRRCVDVMSYYTQGPGQTCSTRDGGSHRRLTEYRALLPTACDIARCRAANGFPPAAQADALRLAR